LWSTSVGVGREQRSLVASVELSCSRFVDPPVLPVPFWWVLAATALFPVGTSSHMFLVLRSQSLGIPASHTPLIGLMFNITYTLLSWPAGLLSDRAANVKGGNSRWRYSIVAVGLLIFAATYAEFAHGLTHFGVYVAMAF